MKKIWKWIALLISIITITCLGLELEKEEAVAADDWYKDYEYYLMTTDDPDKNYIDLTEYKGKAVKSIYVPAKVKIDGVTYTTRLRSFGESIWASANKKLTTLKFQKGVEVAACDSMFSGLTKLKSVNVEVLNMSDITSLSSMFYGCSSLTKLNVSKWDTSNVTNMFNMFGACEKLSTLDVSNWNTSKVTIMTSVFDHCKSLSKINVSNWNVSKVTNTDFMFYKCEVLKSLDLHKWKTSKLTSMCEMFGRCYNLTSVNLKGWNTSKVTTMAGLFSNNYNLTSVDLSSFNMKNVTDTTNMFVRTASLKTIKTPKNVKEDITISSSLSYVKKTGSTLGTKVYSCIPKGKKSITLVCTTGKSKSTKITSISSSSKKINLSWENMAGQDFWGRVQYEVQCSTNKNFTDSVGTMTNALDEGYTFSVHRNITDQPYTTIKGLKKGQTYYVRVRVQIYGQRLSSWSEVKKIKVK